MFLRLLISFIVAFFSFSVYSQNPITGFDEDGEFEEEIFNTANFNKSADSLLKAANNDVIVLGLKSQYRDYIDSAEVFVNNNKGKDLGKGLYLITKSVTNLGSQLKVIVDHPDYYSIDTLLNKGDIKNARIILELKPKFKITLRGRIYTANTPLENVNVEVTYKTDTFRLATRECFYDSEGYWNCLYHGMFKQDITIIDPNDSIKILLYKPGYRTVYSYIKLDEYSGQILNFKLSFDSYLPRIYRNNLSLKFTFPLLSESNWFVGFNYLYTLKLSTFNRLALGVEGAILMKDYQYSYQTFNGAEEAVVDTTYLIGFAGPTAVFWLTNPQFRKFSLYTGASYAYMFSNSTMNFQPFIGGRMFVDMNKAISFDVRYMSYDLDVVNYKFNEFGISERYIVTEEFSKELMISIGLHIGF